MRSFVIVLIAACVPVFSAAQQKDTLPRPAFSYWSFRFNPASFFESLGGIHVGLETNIDRKQKWYVVSEYGAIFINNIGRYDEGVQGGKNSNKISGFETKQELRLRLNSDRGRFHFAAVELHYVQAGVNNSGWFGMGELNSSGQYPFFKYQEFRESARKTSLAVKYGGKLSEKQWLSLEVFAGFGVMYTDITYKNAEGKLYQPDQEAIFDLNKGGLAPYTALGTRLCIRLK